jgi:hypothetical protein
MQTSCFFLYMGPGRVSIARYAPKGIEGLAVFRALAPGKWFNQPPYNSSFEIYRTQYERDILGRLNPKAVYDQLHELTFPHEPVLLCWEKNPVCDPDDWCHRRIVADWFEQELGVKVPEMTIDPPKKPARNPAQSSLFDGY